MLGVKIGQLRRELVFLLAILRKQREPISQVSLQLRQAQTLKCSCKCCGGRITLKSRCPAVQLRSTCAQQE